MYGSGGEGTLTHRFRHPSFIFILCCLVYPIFPLSVSFFFLEAGMQGGGGVMGYVLLSTISSRHFHIHMQHHRPHQKKILELFNLPYFPLLFSLLFVM